MVGLIAGLGGVLLGFGLLSLLLAVFQPLMPGQLVWGNLLAGVLLLLVAAVMGFDSLGDRLRSGGGRRAGALGINAVVVTGLCLVLLGMLAFLSTRYTARFDWTEQQVNTLSEQSLKVVSGLEGEEPIELIAFFRKQDLPTVRDRLERYAWASDAVSVRFVDPNQRPDLVEAHGVSQDELIRGLLLVARGDEAIKLGSPFDEPAITNALVRLSSRASRKVYFLEGHNERKIGGGEPPPANAGQAPEVESADGLAGFARAADAVRNETHAVESLLLATRDEVPEDADVVVIAGPTRPLLESERQALEGYLARGGALMVLLDPRAQTNLYEDLARWGVDVGDDVVVDPVMSVNRQPTAPVAEHYPADPATDPSAVPHPIGEKLSRTVFSMVRSVRPTEADGAITPLVMTSANAWAERGIEDWMKTGQARQDESDLPGPVSIAVVGTPKVPGAEGGASPRIAVFGDSNFATNELLEVFSNRDLFLNTLSWLAGDVDQIAVRPNVARSSTVTLTGGQLQVIQYLALFVLPEGIALLGVLAWWLRRRAVPVPS
jgi:ABC-type uncharacterized transport system involved in gliding motility auxiliary subunit